MIIDIKNSWAEKLQSEFQKAYFQEMIRFLNDRRSQGVEIYPVDSKVFKSFQITPFEKVKVVILGQDPYHQPGQAEGLAFSVPRGTLLPPSLKNIYKELSRDLGIPPASHGHLEKWAEQGVFLLNPIMTVEKGKPLSHSRIGWNLFTDKVLELLFERSDPIIFVLWGQVAKDKAFKLFERLKIEKSLPFEHHLFLVSSHPSPLSAYQGFLGCSHFSKINEELVRMGQIPIDWKLE